ncbi:MAG: GxxExxY protein [Gemmatimonadota bacterium]|nr:GxxExxY protein [Gemmatimonadota bacterium]
MNDDERQDPDTYAIIGAAMEVHRELGPGFLEAVYRHALIFELVRRGIPCQCEVRLLIHYKRYRIPIDYRADLMCFGSVIVELKALTKLTGVDRAQVLNYLKASGRERALLFNFGASSLEYVRLVAGWSHSSLTKRQQPIKD